MIFLCDWGDKVATDEDPNRCLKGAVGIVAVKDGAGVFKLKVCMKHRQVLIDETNPL